MATPPWSSPGPSTLASTNYTNTGTQSASSSSKSSPSSSPTAATPARPASWPNGAGGTDYATAGYLAVENNANANIPHRQLQQPTAVPNHRPAVNTPLVLGTVLDQTGNTSITDILTAAGLTTVTGTGAYANTFNIASVMLGGRTNGAGVSNGDWDGQIGQMLVFNTALSPTDRAAVEAYLAGEWLPSAAALPTTTPLQIAGERHVRS